MSPSSKHSTSVSDSDLNDAFNRNHDSIDDESNDDTNNANDSHADDRRTPTTPSGNKHVSGSDGDDDLSGGDGDDHVVAGSGNDHVNGGMGDDDLQGADGDDHFSDAGGNDRIDGGSGIDDVTYDTDDAQATIVVTDQGVKVTSANGDVDTLIDVERVHFANKTVALDISGNAGQTYRLYQAAFDRSPDNEGLKYWIGQLDGGEHTHHVAQRFVASAEFQAKFGTSPSVESFVQQLYSNVLHREPDAGGFDWWVGQIHTGNCDFASALQGFAESAENQAALIGIIQNGIVIY